MGARGIGERVDGRTGPHGGILFRFFDYRAAVEKYNQEIADNIDTPEISLAAIQQDFPFMKLVDDEKPTLGFVEFTESESQQRELDFHGCAGASVEIPDTDIERILEAQQRNQQRLEDQAAGIERANGTQDAKTFNVQENVSLNVNVPSDCPSSSEILDYFDWLRGSLHDADTLYAWVLLGIALMVRTDQVRIDNAPIGLSEADVADALKSTNDRRKQGGYFWNAIKNKIRKAADWPPGCEVNLDFRHIADLSAGLNLGFSDQRLQCHVRNLRPTNPR